LALRNRQPFSLPAPESARHRCDARVAHSPQRVSRDERALTRCTDEQDLPLVLRHKRAYAPTQFAARDADGAAGHSAGAFIVLAYIDQQRAGAHALQCLRWRDFICACGSRSARWKRMCRHGRIIRAGIARSSPLSPR